MPKITWINKDKNSLTEALRIFTDADANQVKTVVNALDDIIIALNTQVSANNNKVSYTDAAIVAQNVSDIATIQSLLSSDDVDLNSIQEIVNLLKTTRDTLSTIDEGGEIVALIEAALGFTLTDNAQGLSQSSNLSDLLNIDVSNNNLLENNTTGSVTHTVDGADRAISFEGIRKFTLTLDNNIGALTITDLPDSAEFIAVLLTIVQNATVGYNIASILNLKNTDDVFPDMSYEPGTTSIFYIYKTATGVRVIGFGNV